MTLAMMLSGAITGPLTPLGRWVGRRLWWIEHGFERARASDKAVDDTRLRIFFVAALFGAGFVTLGLGATRVAVLSPYGHIGGRLAADPDARADLIDRNGLVLAMDTPRYGLYLDPHEIVHKADVRAQLAPLLASADLGKLDRALAGERPAYVASGLTPDRRDAIHDLALPGVTFAEESGRDFPLGSLAAHVIGFTSKDGAGLAGAERAFNTQVRAGRDPVSLSIDLRVQGALEDEVDQAATALQVQDAVGLVVNVRTGEILGMASWPSFDAAQADKADPRTMVNHAAATVYEPGSVMKVFTLAMGIDAGIATPDTVFDVRTPLVIGDRVIHDFEGGPPTLTLTQVFTHSSNIGAARLGLEAGPERMARYYKGFGLFDAAPSELIESARPLTARQLSPTTVASMSFGHAISVSPLAIATGMSAILNGGVYRPLTLRKLDPGQAPAPGRRVIQESTSQTMLQLMRLNVLQGTGAKANVPGLRVGGKTGTATKIVGGHYVEGRNAANLASFAAIFPTDAPIGADRYYVLIMMDAPKANAADGGVTTAAMTAAPVAARVIERIAPFVGVPRVIEPSDLQAKPAPDPALLGAHEQ